MLAGCYSAPWTRGLGSVAGEMGWGDLVDDPLRRRKERGRKMLWGFESGWT